MTLNKTAYTFEPNGMVYNNVNTDQSRDYVATLDTFIIWGYAVDSVTFAPLAGVLVTPDGNGGQFTSKYYGGGSYTTDVNGYYEVLVDYNWSGNVVPSKYTYTFEPNSLTYTNVTQDIEDQNYVGTQLTNKISGYIKDANSLIPIAGVLVTANNDGGSYTTDANGYYEVVVVLGWSGNVTPSKSGYAFQPNSRTYADVIEDQQEQNYTGILSAIKITGYIKNACQVPIANVHVNANNGGDFYTTDANGYYEVGVSYNWSGSVMLNKAHYTFDPNGRTYTDVIADQTDQNYTANNIYDLDCSGRIGFGDVAVISANWLHNNVDINDGDFNDDDIVNFKDFTDFAEVWLDN